MLSESDQKTLLLLARATLEEYVRHQKMPTLESLDIPLTPTLREPRGAFVTLYSRSSTSSKELRGCIGSIQPVQPLFQAVMNNTVNACSQDGRFLPVRKEELANIMVEINVLTPPHAIDSYQEIVLGRDGIILSQDHHQAVFLPSVPLEWGWSRAETLSHLSLKAGLAAEAWREEKTCYHVFQSVSFSE